MSSFQYFFPGKNAPLSNSSRIEDVSLRAVFGDDQPLAYGVMSQGPGGQAGLMFARSGQTLSCDLEKQRWEVVRANSGADAGNPLYYVGFDKEDPPTPDDLARAIQLPGPMVRMRDGSEWKVPEIHAPDGTPLVPQTMRFVDGRFVGSADPTYESLCQRAAEMYRRMWSPDSTIATYPDFAECFGFFADVLAVNYHVGPVECALLEIFSSDGEWFMGEFTAATFGIKAILDNARAQKKMAARPGDGLSSNAGSVDLPPATVPALPT